MSERNNTYEVYRDAQGNLQWSAYVPHWRFKHLVRFQVDGLAEIIEGEMHSYSNVWLFCANPCEYPAEHEDIYGVPLDAATVDAFSYQVITERCHSLRNLVIEKF